MTKQQFADWGISARLDAEAVSQASARLAAAARHARQHKAITDAVYYGGPGEPIEEPVPDARSRSSVDAVLTRNHYGCVVLNAAHALFIDVDVLTPSPCEASGADVGCGGESELWRKTFDDLSLVLADEKSEGFRIYQTAAGFRILATAHEFEPCSASAQRLMETVGADAAFVKLCRIQKSFRARLTPKPWRCGSRRPPNLFPRVSVDEQRRFANWLTQYERACRHHATCRYLGHIGLQRTDQRIAPVIEFHDRETRALKSLPLA